MKPATPRVLTLALIQAACDAASGVGLVRLRVAGTRLPLQIVRVLVGARFHLLGVPAVFHSIAPAAASRGWVPAFHYSWAVIALSPLPHVVSNFAAVEVARFVVLSGRLIDDIIKVVDGYCRLF